MIRRPPRSTRTDTLFPYTTLFRSDFHPYCYRVYHWNLPSNPVDLEQREGRVHRYKGHAVRLNPAERQVQAVRGRGHAPADPWALMFNEARREAAVDTDLIPYWIYEGSVRVERRVPMLRMSAAVTRLAWLKRSLTVYRLALDRKSTRLNSSH